MKQCSPRLYDMRARLAAALARDLDRARFLGSVYIALAIEYGCSMLTADSRLLRGTRHPVIHLLS